MRWYHECMRESPREPKNLDPVDEEALAVIGHRIERWDILRDVAVPFEERRQRVNNDIREEIEQLIKKEEAAVVDEEEENLAHEQQELILETKDLWELQNNTEQIEEFCRERIQFWSEVKRELLKRI